MSGTPDRQDVYIIDATPGEADEADVVTGLAGQEISDEIRFEGGRTTVWWQQVGGDVHIYASPDPFAGNNILAVLQGYRPTVYSNQHYGARSDNSLGTYALVDGVGAVEIRMHGTPGFDNDNHFGPESDANGNGRMFGKASAVDFFDIDSTAGTRPEADEIVGFTQGQDKIRVNFSQLRWRVEDGATVVYAGRTPGDENILVVLDGVSIRLTENDFIGPVGGFTLREIPYIHAGTADSDRGHETMQGDPNRHDRFTVDLTPGDRNAADDIWGFTDGQDAIAFSGWMKESDTIWWGVIANWYLSFGNAPQLIYSAVLYDSPDPNAGDNVLAVVFGFTDIDRSDFHGLASTTRIVQIDGVHAATDGSDEMRGTPYLVDTFTIDSRPGLLAQADVIRGFVDGEDRLRLDLPAVWFKAVETEGRTDTILFSDPAAGDHHVLAVMEGYDATASVIRSPYQTSDVVLSHPPRASSDVVFDSGDFMTDISVSRLHGSSSQRNSTDMTGTRGAADLFMLPDAHLSGADLIHGFTAGEDKIAVPLNHIWWYRYDNGDIAVLNHERAFYGEPRFLKPSLRITGKSMVTWISAPMTLFPGEFDRK